jgi:hypothetical protein
LYAHLDESVDAPKSIVYLSKVEQTNGPTSCYPGVLDALGLGSLQDMVGRVIANVGNAADSPLRAYYAKQYHQSMSSEAFRRHFMRLPAAIRFNSHLGWDVLPDSAAERVLSGAERTMLGEPGTFIVFDGARLFHRGGLVMTGERVVLQVVFSATNPIRRLTRRIKDLLR